MENKINSQIQQKWSNVSPEDQKIIQDKLAKLDQTTSNFRQNLVNADSQSKTVTNYYGAEEEKLQTKGRLTTTGAITLASAAFGPLGYAAIAARTVVNASIGEVKGLSEQTLKSQREELEKELALGDMKSIASLLENLGDQKISPVLASQISENFKWLNNKFLLTGQMEAEYLKIEAKLSPVLHPENFVPEGQEIPENSQLTNTLLTQFSNKLDKTTAKVLGQEFTESVKSEFNDPKKRMLRIGMVVGASVAGLAFSAYIGRPVLQGLYKTIFQHGETLTLPTQTGNIRLQSSHIELKPGEKILGQQGDLLIVGKQGQNLPTDGEIATALDNHFKNAPKIEGAKVSDFKTPGGRILEGVRTVAGKIDGKSGILITDENNPVVSYDDTEIRFDKGTSGRPLEFEHYKDQTVIGKYGDQLVIADKNAPKSSIDALNSMKEVEKYAAPATNPSIPELGQGDGTTTPLPNSPQGIVKGLAGEDQIIQPSEFAKARQRIGFEMRFRSDKMSKLEPDGKDFADLNQEFQNFKLIGEKLNALKQDQSLKLDPQNLGSYTVLDAKNNPVIPDAVRKQINDAVKPDEIGLGDSIISKTEKTGDQLGKIQGTIDKQIAELKNIKTGNSNDTGVGQLVNQRIKELTQLKANLGQGDEIKLSQAADGKLNLKVSNATDNSKIPPIPQDGSIPETPKPVDQRLVPKPTFQDPLGSTNLANSFGQNMSNEITKKLGPDIDNNELPLLNDILKKYAKKISKDDFTPEDVDRIIKNLSAHFKNNPSAKIRIDTIESDRIVFTSTSDSNLQISFPEDPRVIADPGSLAQPFEQRINENDEIIKTLTGGIRKDEVGKLEAQLNNLFKDKPQMKPLIQDMRRELDKYFANTANTNKTVRYGGILLGKDAKLNRIVLEGASGEELTAFDDTITTQPTVPKVQTIQPQSVTRTNTTSQFPNANQTNNGIIRTQPTSPQQPTITRVPDTARPGVETQQPNITQPVQPLAPTQKGEFLGSNTTELPSYLPESRGGIGKIDILFGKGNKPDPAVSNLLSRMNTSGSNISIKDLKGIAQVTGLYKNSNGDLLTGADIRKDLDNILQQQGLTVQNLTSTDIDKLLFETYKVERIGGMGVGVYGGETPSLQDVQRYQQILEKVNQEFVAEGKLIYNPGDYSEQMFNPAYPNAEQEYGDILALKRNEFVLSLKGRNTTNYNANFRIGNEARGASAWARDVYDKSNQTIQPQGLSNPATPPTGLTNQVTQTNLTDNGVLSLTPANVEAFNNATTPGQTMVLTNNIPKPPQGTSFITYPVANNSFGADVNPADGRTNEIVGGYEIREYSNGYTLLFQTDPNADLLPGEYSAIPTMGPNPTPDQTLPAKIRFHVGDSDNPIYQTQANLNKQAIPAQPINAGNQTQIKPINNSPQARIFKLEAGDRPDVNAIEANFNNNGIIPPNQNFEQTKGWFPWEGSQNFDQLINGSPENMSHHLDGMAKWANGNMNSSDVETKELANSIIELEKFVRTLPDDKEKQAVGFAQTAMKGLIAAGKENDKSKAEKAAIDALTTYFNKTQELLPENATPAQQNNLAMGILGMIGYGLLGGAGLLGGFVQGRTLYNPANRLPGVSAGGRGGDWISNTGRLRQSAMKDVGLTALGLPVLFGGIFGPLNPLFGGLALGTIAARAANEYTNRRRPLVPMV